MINSRERWIDSIKGILCLIVFFYHYYLTFGNDNLKSFIGKTPLAIMVNGIFAVNFFVFISAYIVGMQIFTNKKTIEITQKISVKRYPRLVFPIVLIQFISFLLGKMGLLYDSSYNNSVSNEWLKTHLIKTNSTFFDLVKSSFFSVIFKGDSTYNIVLWIMPILFFGVFISIILSILFLKKSKGMYIILTVIGVLFVLKGDAYICVFIGVFMAYLKYKTDIYKKTNHKRIIAILLIIAGILIPTYFSNFAVLNNYNLWNSLAIIFIVIAIECSKHLKNFLNKNKILNYLGEISFSVFLIHWLIIITFSCYCYSQYDLSIPLQIVVFFITVIIVLMSSIGWHEVLEKRVFYRITNSIYQLYKGRIKNEKKKSAILGDDK